MSKTIDHIYKWKGWGNGVGTWLSWCRIRIFETPENSVVIASDCGPNSGTSITNCIENLVPLVVASYSLNPYRTVWIEHYPELSLSETFSEVMLQRKGNKLCNPIWNIRKKEEIEQLIGEKLCK